MNPDALKSVPEWIHDERCSCTSLAQSLDSGRLKLNEGSGLWTLLVISQDGGGTAADVKLTTKDVQVGALDIYDLTDIWYTPATSADSPEPLPVVADATEREFEIGTIKAGETVVVPLFLSLFSVVEKPEETAERVVVSETFVPTLLSFIDLTSREARSVDVRRPSLNPVQLTTGVRTRG